MDERQDPVDVGMTWVKVTTLAQGAKKEGKASEPAFDGLGSPYGLCG